MKQKATELEEFLSDKIVRTFPRAAAGRFVQRFGQDGTAFVTSMERFHQQIAEYCSLGKGWLQADEPAIAACRKAVGEPFFIRYPEFRSLEPRIAEFPDIAELMALFEVARKRLKALLATLEQVRKR